MTTQAEKIREISEIVEREVSHATARMWENYGKSRLYISRSGSKKDAGYIDLDTGDLHVSENHVDVSTITKIEKILAE